MWPIVTDVARSMVCVSVCCLHGWAVKKTAEPIEMPFGDDSCESKKPCIRNGTLLDMWLMQLFAKWLWTLLLLLLFDAVYLRAKLDDSSYSCSRDIIGLGASKFKVGHVTQTAPILRVICHPYAGTWHSLDACTIWPLCSFSRSGHMDGWCQPKFKSFTWPDHTPFKEYLPYMGLHLLRSTYLPNLKSSPTLPTTQIRKAIQNVENGVVVVKGSLEVTGNSVIR